MTSTALTAAALEDPRRVDRIRAHTPAHVNERIDLLTNAIVAARAAEGREAIVARLTELDHEWDADRAVVTNFAIVGGISSLLGERSTFWKAFFRVQQGFLLWHAVVGWCPPTSLFRRLGFRTQKEIDAERVALTRLLESTER